jgi:hypothetical protein
MAALVKAYAGLGLVLHLALVARDRGVRRAAGHAAGAAALAVLLYAPFWGGLDTFGGAGGVARRFGTSLTGTLYRLLTMRGPGVAEDLDATAIALIVAGAAFVLLVTALSVRHVWREPGPRTLWTGVAFAFGAYLLASPWFFPWHLVPLVALAAARPADRPSAAVLVASVTTPIAVRFDPYELGLASQAVVRYGPPVAVLARRRGRPEPSR